MYEDLFCSLGIKFVIVFIFLGSFVFLDEWVKCGEKIYWLRVFEDRVRRKI